MSQHRDPTIDALLAHNRWANRVLMDALVALDDAQWHAAFDIGPGSLHNIMTHVLSTMSRWADRIDGRPVRAAADKDGHKRPVVEIAQMLDAAAAELDEVHSRHAQSGGLDEFFELPWEQKVYHFTRRVTLAHVALHGAHHRAQAINIRRRLRLAPLGWDLDLCEWQAMTLGEL